MAEAMRKHQVGTARVVPVILRLCAWQRAPFAGLQVLPKDGHPIMTRPDRDQVCFDVAEGVMRVVRELRGEPHHYGLGEKSLGGERRTLEARVHRAFFSSQTEECHFINLTNLSPKRVLGVAHVLYEDDAHHIPIIQASRPLPVRLDLDQS